MHTHAHTHAHTHTHTHTYTQMSVVVESLTVTIEQEVPGGHTLPVLSVRMGDKSSSKAFKMSVENWTTAVRTIP